MRPRFRLSQRAKKRWKLIGALTAATGIIAAAAHFAHPRAQVRFASPAPHKSVPTSPRERIQRIPDLRQSITRREAERNESPWGIWHVESEYWGRPTILRTEENAILEEYMRADEALTKVNRKFESNGKQVHYTFSKPDWNREMGSPEDYLKSGSIAKLRYNTNQKKQMGVGTVYVFVYGKTLDQTVVWVMGKQDEGYTDLNDLLHYSHAWIEEIYLPKH